MLPRIRASSSTTAIFGFKAAGVISSLRREQRVQLSPSRTQTAIPVAAILGATSPHVNAAPQIQPIA